MKSIGISKNKIFKKMAKKIGIGFLKKKNTEFIRELSTEEIDIYNLYSNILIESNKSSWIFKILKINYYILMSETYKDFETMDLRNNIEWEIMEEKTILVNKRFGDFLSSFSSFNDHSRKYLSNTFGKDSNELKEFIEASKFQFDNNFGYRFFCKGLRDYSIHCGMPVVSIKLLQNNQEKIVKLLFDRNELLTNMDWKKLIKTELENKPDFFEVTNLVYDSMNSCEELNKIIFSFNDKLMIEATDIIQKTFNFINNNECKSCLFIWDSNENYKNAKIGQIPFHLMRKKNVA